MALSAQWEDSSKEIIMLPASGGSPAGFKLASSSLLGAVRLPPDAIVRGDDPRRLVQAGQRKAREEERPVLLRLTGRRGRPEERIVVPPKPPKPATRAAGSRGAGAKREPKVRTAGDGERVKVGRLEAQVARLRTKGKEMSQALRLANARVAALEERLEEERRSARRAQENHDREVAQRQTLIDRLRSDCRGFQRASDASRSPLVPSTHVPSFEGTGSPPGPSERKWIEENGYVGQ